MTEKEEIAQRETDIQRVKDHVSDFLNNTISARAASTKARNYKDGNQWTDEEAAVLKKRKQAPIVINRVKPKVEGLLGLVSMRTSDPKAYPRTQKHEDAANCATDALRYVSDNNDFQTIRLDVADNFFVEGYGGAIVKVKPTHNDKVEIFIDHIPWDRIYFDPNSRKKDFSDARYMGIIMWMDAEEAQEKFPDANIKTIIAAGETSGNGMGGDTFDDKVNWTDKKNGRIRIAQEFYIKNGKWYMCIATDGEFLLEPDLSPYDDEFGEPCNPIELVSAYIDRENNRYGEVQAFLDPQDEINHRRSKALHLLSQRQTASRKGAVKDIAGMKREMAKPDGHVEYTGEKGDFEILQTSDMARGQFELYQDAKNELDAVSYNAQLAGQRQGDLSGRAIDKLQSAGTIELNGLFTILNGWEKRIYRQIWARVKQFWNEEKWIRVTDDIDNLRWVGLNTEVTVQEWLEEQINDQSKPLHIRQAAAASFTQLMQLNDPTLQKVISVKNDVAELDVDIILDQSFDSVNIQQEQFELLAKFAQGGDIDVTELIELSQLRGKDDLIEKISKRREAAAQSAAQMEPKDEAKMKLDLKKHQDTMEFELQKHRDQMQVEIQKIDAKKAEKGVNIQVNKDGHITDVIKNEEETAQKQAEMALNAQLAAGVIQAVNNLTEAVMAPSRAIRGSTGKIIGVTKEASQ